MNLFKKYENFYRAPLRVVEVKKDND